NGANSSFVHQIVDEEVKAEEIARDPFETIATQGPAANPSIPAPLAIFGAGRRNSKGWDITDPLTLEKIEASRAIFAGEDHWSAKPVTRAAGDGRSRKIVNPAKPSEVVGTVEEASAEQVAIAVGFAAGAQPAWAARRVAERATALRRAADLYEANAVEFFALATREAGKTLADGIA
ncbi:aldehyde dehydrogenase family protein, partial [Rhizobiaceae sp. 2RAB30]